jgi:hypothetical protein
MTAVVASRQPVTISQRAEPCGVANRSIGEERLTIPVFIGAGRKR